MLINVGGFGHTGNTAVQDLLLDTGCFAPLANNFGESAVLRGRWCVAGMLRSLEAGRVDVPIRYFFDALIGVTKKEHARDNPPGVNEFKRNANVHRCLGSGYVAAVSKLVHEFERALEGSADKSHFSRHSLLPFFHRLTDLALKRSSSQGCTHALTRNDPAGYAVGLLEFSTHSRHLSVIRDPVDSAYEWANYYYDRPDEETIRRFTSQFKRKLKRFLNEYSALPPDIKERIAVVSFEDVVQSSKVRATLCNYLHVSRPAGSKRFNPEQSVKNIGVGRKMPSPLQQIVISGCRKEYDRFITECQSIVIGG